MTKINKQFNSRRTFFATFISRETKAAEITKRNRTDSQTKQLLGFILTADR
jgi:hypothetical protein